MPSTHQTWTSFCICHQLSLLDFDHIDQCKRTTLEQVAWHIFNFITLYFFYISSTFLSTCELKQRVLIRPIRWKIWALSVTVNPSRWAAVDTLKLRLVTAHLFLSSVKMSLKKKKEKKPCGTQGRRPWIYIILFTWHLGSHFDSTITFFMQIRLCLWCQLDRSLAAKAITINYVGVAIHISLSFVCFLFINGIIQIKQVTSSLLLFYFCIFVFVFFVNKGQSI